MPEPSSAEDRQGWVMEEEKAKKHASLASLRCLGFSELLCVCVFKKKACLNFEHVFQIINSGGI